MQKTGNKKKFKKKNLFPCAEAGESAQNFKQAAAIQSTFALEDCCLIMVRTTLVES